MKDTAPNLTYEQFVRRSKILNSSNPNFFEYGHKVSDIEKIIKIMHKNYLCSYDEALAICQDLIKSNVHEEKFAGIFFLNRFKNNFNKTTIDFFEDQLSKYCDTWAFCDTSCIRVIGPFLAKKNNKILAEKTINKWSNSEHLWVRRASLVILLKIIMVQKEFNENYVYEFVGKMLQYDEDYIQKGIGWLLKTCSNYNSDSVFKYLMSNKRKLSRLILRYASEKLPKENREKILFFD